MTTRNAPPTEGHHGETGLVALLNITFILLFIYHKLQFYRMNYADHRS